MLGLVPLFCSGGLLLVQTMQQRTDVFCATMGDRLMWADGLSTVTFAFLAIRRWRTGGTRRCMAVTCWDAAALDHGRGDAAALGLVAVGRPCPPPSIRGSTLRWSSPWLRGRTVAMGAAPSSTVHHHRRGDRDRVDRIPSRVRDTRLGSFGVAVAAAPTWLVAGIGFAMGAAAMGLGWMAPLRRSPGRSTRRCLNQVLLTAMPAATAIACVRPTEYLAVSEGRQLFAA